MYVWHICTIILHTSLKKKKVLYYMLHLSALCVLAPMLVPWKKSQNLFKYYKYPTLLDKIKVSLGNMGNLMETPWEHDRNTTQKIPSPLPLPPKGKKDWTLHECMLSLVHWLHKTIISKNYLSPFFDMRKHIRICEDESLRWFMRPNPNKVWEDESLRWIMKPIPNKVW